MPVTLRRTAVGESEEQAEKAERQAALLRESAGQLQERRAEALATMRRFARGITLWQEQGWQWEEPDWEAEPESWPALARLLYLYDRLQSEMNSVSWLWHFPGHPEACCECGPMPEGKRHVNTPCIGHRKHAASLVRAYADQLGMRNTEKGEGISE